MTCPVLIDLATEAVELWASPEQERRRRLWADHFNSCTSEVPVSCAMFQGWQDLVWQQLLSEDSFVYKTRMPRLIETHLRHTLWRAQQVPDDTPANPTLKILCLPALAPDELWGVPLAYESTDVTGGAYKPVPPLQENTDLSRLRLPAFQSDEVNRQKQEHQVRELVGDVLPIVFQCDALHNGPFEWAVRLRGMDNLLLDCYDRPDWLHALMHHLTEGIVRYHRAREMAGYAVGLAECQLHSPWDDIPPGQERQLSGAWGYLHAQSAASYSPDMYAEFIQPYNARIAELWGKVYYHGCEDLTRKAVIIRDLPNLRQFHVSPWSQVTPIAAALPEQVTLEVHSHPTNVLFLWDQVEMRKELNYLTASAGDHLFNLKLCDIQTINADGGQALIAWSRQAKEAAAACRG